MELVGAAIRSRERECVSERERARVRMRELTIGAPSIYALWGCWRTCCEISATRALSSKEPVIDLVFELCIQLVFRDPESAYGVDSRQFNLIVNRVLCWWLLANIERVARVDLY